MKIDTINKKIKLEISNKEDKKVLEDLLELLDSKKCEDIIAIDISEVSNIAKYIIITTANSMVHSRSLTKHIINFFEEKKLSKLLFNKNLDSNNPWILLDATDFLINIFQTETREFYNLEKIFFKGRTIYSSLL